MLHLPPPLLSSWRTPKIFAPGPQDAGRVLGAAAVGPATPKPDGWAAAPANVACVVASVQTLSNPHEFRAAALASDRRIFCPNNSPPLLRGRRAPSVPTALDLAAIAELLPRMRRRGCQRADRSDCRARILSRRAHHAVRSGPLRLPSLPATKFPIPRAPTATRWHGNRANGLGFPHWQHILRIAPANWHPRRARCARPPAAPDHRRKSRLRCLRLHARHDKSRARAQRFVCILP